MVDSSCAIDTTHTSAFHNLSFMRADILGAPFAAMLTAHLPRQLPPRVMVGIHLCGALSPRAVSLFGQLSHLLEVLVLVPCCLNRRADASLKRYAKDMGIDPYVLVPCCLNRRADASLKRYAKDMGIDPYEAKVQQLRELFLSLNLPTLRVRILRDDAMRSRRGAEASRGNGAIKNAVIIGCYQQTSERSSTVSFYDTWVGKTRKDTLIMITGW
eukprot:CAMPEP_0119346352 /NCGR_PEP_ID=MMETSP1333-20130426/107959_1 /TAXON_ID=418940 /ORGANISM="Scyphosphaera apsteinii, Strain RCC1455" /LENGTH=213 /DNA_ID=CAMNT_0007358851 /DNA_START=176 /DNA_END=814 /DNA_ORIENTATION=-